MDQFTGFQAGVNLGGWISQYDRYDHEHFKTFITQADIQRIASWGMDHVRLPFDYPVLEDDDTPFQYKESGWGYLDSCLEWCEAAGLNLILVYTFHFYHPMPFTHQRAFWVPELIALNAQSRPIPAWCLA